MALSLSRFFAKLEPEFDRRSAKIISSQQTSAPQGEREYYAREPITFEDKRKVMGGNSDLAGDPYMMGHITVAGANFMFDDIVTIADSNATAADKMMAGLFLFGKPVKLVDKGYDLYRSAYKTRKVDKGNAVSEFAGKINATNIPNMSKKDILDNLPNKWKHTDHNGFIHIRDSKGNIRMKIDPPDKVTKYDHVHIFDENGNPLDINLNIVDRKSPDAHIPYENEDD